MLSILRKKMVRDIGRSKWQFLAVIVTVVMGVAFFSALYSSYENLNRSANYTYDTLNLADLVVTLNEAPARSVDEVRSLDGVKAAVGRTVLESRVIPHANIQEDIVGRFISLPSNEGSTVNDVYIVKGSSLNGANEEEDSLIVEKGFAEQHRLAVGDYVKIGISSNPVSFKVAGIAVTPEQIVPARDTLRHCSVILRDWGVFFVSQEAMGRIFNADRNTVNEIAILVTEPNQRDNVVAAVKRTLEPYGIKEVITKDDQPSNKFVKLYVDSLRDIGTVFPIFFLTVAAASGYMLLNRMVTRQRQQIGVLLATGYTRRQIIAHYLGFALSIGVIGSLIGPVVGYLLLVQLTRLLVAQINLPFIQIELNWSVVLAAVSLSLLFTGIAGFLAVWSATKHSPVDLMRLQRPTSGRAVLVERLLPPLRKLTTSWKMTYRNIFRNKRRSALTAVGISLSLSIAFVPFAYMDAMDSSLNLMFNKIQRYDLRATFTEPQNLTVTSELKNWSVVKTVEPLILMPTPLSHGENKHTTIVNGLQEGTTLYEIYDFEGKKVTLDKQGILLSRAFREFGNVKAGDNVTLDLSELVSKYWKGIEERKREISNQMLQNITQLHESAYTLRQNLTQTHALLYSLKANVTQTLSILYGVPSGYAATWKQVLESTYLRSYPNSSLTIYDVNSIANQTFASQLATELGKTDKEYATFVWGYYQMFFSTWNSTFPNSNPEPADLLEKPTPTQRLQLATDPSVTMYLNDPLISPSVGSFYQITYSYFNFTTWMNETVVDRAVPTLLFRMGGSPQDASDLVNKLYLLSPNPANEQFDNLVIAEVSRMLPSEFQPLVEKAYALGPEATSADFKQLSETIADELVDDALAKHPPPAKSVEIRVVGFVNDPFGYSAFLTLENAQSIFGLGDGVTNLMISLADTSDDEGVKASLYQNYPVWNVENQVVIKQDVANMLNLFYGFLGSIAVFGIVMAFAIVFNTITVSVMERGREVATMRTLGMGSRRIAAVITIENLLLSVAGILLGVPLAVTLSKYFTSLWVSELISIDFTIYPSTYLLATGGVLGIALLSGIPAIRSVYRLNLAKITKEQVS